MNNRYSNFVRPSQSSRTIFQPSISGDEARRFYLEEIKEPDNPYNRVRSTASKIRRHFTKEVRLEDINRKDLFLSVQNDDIERLCHILDACPSMINISDDYGWSLLMIACQANSVHSVKELLKRGINTSVRDKGGNSAQSLTIRNRNLVLADILLSYKSIEDITTKSDELRHKSKQKSKSMDNYLCEICDKEFPSKDGHLSSTIHNINASKGKKIHSSYAIPSSNKGYQLMLKTGWDRQSGLGPDGSGKKYPIKTVQKQDRKGLGLDKRKQKQEAIDSNRKLLDKGSINNRDMEINFRRQFY